MVKGNYKPLGCSVASCAGRHEALGFCLRHYRQHCRGGIKQDITACVNCGAEFEPFNAQSMYCSKACKIDAWRIRATGRGRAQRASEKAANARRREIERIVKREVAALHRIARYIERPRIFRFNCVHCATPMIVRRNGGLHKQCCDDCRSESIRSSRRSHKASRRAREKGVETDSINPIKVFERDKWRCHICGVNTPHRLRGTYDDRAPEIDHIVPLSKGGPHTWGNVACSCRKCNQKKGATAFGQLGLAIAA